MANLYITEYSSTGDVIAQGNVALEPEITTQVVAFTGTAAASSAFNNATTFVRLQPDNICSVLFSAAGTAATTSNRRMVSGQTEYFKVPRNKAFKVSAITNT